MAEPRLTYACKYGSHCDHPSGYGCKGYTSADPDQPRKSPTVKCECSCHEETSRG